MKFETLNYSAVHEHLEILTIRKWSILYLGHDFLRKRKDIIVIGLFCQLSSNENQAIDNIFTRDNRYEENRGTFKYDFV